MLIETPYDLINQRSGKLTVLSVYSKENDRFYYLCRCDCGKLVVRKRSIIQDTTNKVSMCHDCYLKMKEKKAIDSIEPQYGDLTVLGFSRKVPKEPQAVFYYMTQCKCGRVLEVSKKDLTCGRKRSCGHCPIICYENENSKVLFYKDENKYVHKCLKCGKVTLITNPMIGRTIQCDCYQFSYMHNINRNTLRHVIKFR